MARSILCLLVLLLSANIIHDGWSLDITLESENCLCECGESVCDLVGFVKDLDKRLSVATNEIVKLVTLHNTFIAAQRKNAMEHKEIRNLIRKLSKQQNSNDSPSFEALTRLPEDTMADEADQMTKKNFTTLIEEVNGKFKEVKSLSSDVTELQQENKVLKEEMEKEKRVRRSLQHQVYFVEEGLNQTQSWVLEINEKVNEKDSTNSTIDEVAEIVFAKIAEFDALNKTAIENQLKKLEYTVKDVFRNESQLVQRLDSVANVSAYTASLLLENGTLVDKVHDISSTMQVLEKIQTQQSESIGQLEQHVDVVHDSLVRKLEEVQYAVSTIDSSTNETMLSFGNELSKLSDRWNNKSIAIDDAFSKINTTKDIEIFFKTSHLEALGLAASSLQEEIKKNQIMLQELTRRSDELTDIKILLNRTTDKEEFYELSKNVAEQNRVLEEKAFVYFSNLSEIINNTTEKMTDLENKYALENDLIAQYVNVVSSRQQEAQEKAENLSTEFENFKWNQSITLSLLETRMENFSLKVNKSGEQSLKISSIAEDVNMIRDLQSASEHAVSRRLQVMEELLMKRINVNQEETVQLINKLEASINSSRQGDETLPEEHESVSSRLRIHVGGDPTEATTENPVPCLYDPLMNSDELAAAYLREAVYENLSADTVILQGEQILFSCKKIGKFVLVGSETLTCINGQWSGEIPRCQKLLDEGAIRGAIQQDPCLEPRGQFPDPSDCTKYYNCWDGKKVWSKCPNGLHFNATQMKCDYSSTTNCNIHHSKGGLESLANMIPPIDFAPLGVDIGDSLLATSVTGELVVYPGVTLNLLCLYPRALGEPEWEIKEKVSHPHIFAWDTRGIAELKDAYKLKLTIKRATEDYSGNYTCASPSGQRHTIRVLVKAVKCPDFAIDSSTHLSVSYRPHPEGLQKVMTTRALFYCSHGYSLNGSDTATCEASGTWSQDLPTCDQRDGCVKPYLDNRLGLFVEPDKSTFSVGEKFYYRCQNPLKLIGVTTARCIKDGTWTVKNHPFCIRGK